MWRIKEIIIDFIISVLVISFILFLEYLANYGIENAPLWIWILCYSFTIPCTIMFNLSRR